MHTATSSTAAATSSSSPATAPHRRVYVYYSTQSLQPGMDDTRATGDGHDSRPRLNNAIVMTRRRQPFPFNMALKFAPPPFIPPASTTPSSRHAAAAIALRLTFTPFDSHSRRHPSHPFAANLHYHDTTSSRSLTIATSSSPPCSLFMGFQCIWTRKSHSSQMTDDRRLNHDDNAVSPPSPPIAL
ncbi:hypothetical protein BD779DRAFT_1671055 [Infundibulicybe gibba]|nr:hypothetical protein BD779DRAFT_1671055 [Infundibulicybe gibba]